MKSVHICFMDQAREKGEKQIIGGKTRTKIFNFVKYIHGRINNTSKYNTILDTEIQLDS